MMTCGDLVCRNGAPWPNKDAFIELGRRVRWGELDKRTDALGHALRGFGINVGDRVAVLAHDGIEVAETFLAASKSGAIRVGLNARLAACNNWGTIFSSVHPITQEAAGKYQRPISFPKLRKVPRQFSWVDQRLVRERYIDQLSHAACTLLVKQQLGVGNDRSALAQEHAPASAAGAPRLQEAFVSCTLTLYDTSEQALFPRIRHALAWAKTQGACKTDRQCLS